jgi:hypothetical protein
MAEKWQTHWQAPASKTAAERVEALKLVLRFAEGKAKPEAINNILTHTFGRYGGSKPTDAEWEIYRVELLGQFRALADGGEVEFTSPEYRLHVSGGAGGLPAYDGHGITLRKAAVIRLIADHGWRIARCKHMNCGKLFIRTSNSLHCSPQCANAARAARHYARVRHAE